MTKNSKDETAVTLDALIKWSKGKASDEESTAIQADLGSPKSRILTLLGDPRLVIKHIESAAPQALDAWRKSHRDQFSIGLTSAQSAAWRDTIDPIIEKNLQATPLEKLQKRRKRDDTGHRDR